MGLALIVALTPPALGQAVTGAQSTFIDPSIASSGTGRTGVARFWGDDALGELRLDYGLSIATDIDGNVIGEFTSFEAIRSLGLGVNVFELLEHGLRALGRDPPSISQYVDISLGHTWKDIEVDLAPASVTLSGQPARGEAKEKDRGALLRVTPFDRIRGDAGGSEHRPQFRVDAAFGFSQRNYDDVTIAYIDQSQPHPIVEDRRIGAMEGRSRAQARN